MMRLRRQVNVLDEFIDAAKQANQEMDVAPRTRSSTLEFRS